MAEDYSMPFVLLLWVAVAVLILIGVARWRLATRDDLAKPLGSIEPPVKNDVDRGSADTATARRTEALIPAPREELVAKQDALSPNQSFRGWKWKTIAFMDVETTGLTYHDRVVTLAIILLDVPPVNEGQTQVEITLRAIHRIYNPGRDCNPVAARVHGHSDWTLRHQPFFIEEAEEISEYIQRADLVVCHNAEFDLRFMNREFSKASMPTISTESFCTMEGYRRKYLGSASLNNVIRQLGLKREGGNHGALEDAWLTMNVFFLLNDAKAGFPFSIFGEDQRKLHNFRDVPSVPEGDLPPRRRRSRAKP
jgi:DNA polymerase-3 subunit epsilon